MTQTDTRPVGGAESTEASTVPRLKQRYRDEIKPALQEQFSFDNVMQVPGVVKVVVNMGVGEAARDAKLINGAYARRHSLVPVSRIGNALTDYHGSTCRAVRIVRR